MNVFTCEPSCRATCWKDINFHAAVCHVEKLQKRIASAFLKGDYGKVSFLQHNLIHSFYAKALAVYNVTSNKGKGTPGVDGILWDTPKLKFDAISDLNRKGYKHQPLWRVYVPKTNGGSRPLGIPTMKDRAMQTLYRFALDPIAEITGDPHSYAYRPKRSVSDAVWRCVDILSNDPSSRFVLKADIKSCFDTFSHEWIMNHIPIDSMILQQFLKCGYIENFKFYPTKKGVPQGGCISSTICNMVLDGLEGLLKQNFGNSVNMIRYADDILITGPSRTLLVQSIVPVVERFLSERGLQLSHEKTKVYHVKNEFQFLGWKIYKDENEIIAMPSKRSVDSLFGKVEDIVRKYSKLSDEELCKYIEREIRGWLNYFWNMEIPYFYYGIEYDMISLLLDLSCNKKIADFVGELFSRYN